MAKDDKTGTRALLWLNRATTFITLLIDKVAEGKEPSAAAKETYQDVLKPYHGMMTSMVVGKAMSAAPKKEVILDALGPADRPLTEDEAKVQMEAFLTPMKALVGKILKFLEAEECNFDNKV